MPQRDPARVAVELTNQVFVHIGVALLLLFLIRDLQFGYILDIARNGQSGVPLGTYLAATVLSGIVAYMSARFLIRYFRVGRLDPFAAYCAALGVLTILVVR